MQKYVFSMSSQRKTINYYYFFTFPHTSPQAIARKYPYTHRALATPCQDTPP